MRMYKTFFEFGIKEAKWRKIDKEISFSSLSSCDIHNRNSLLIRQARKKMEMSAFLGVKFHGSESFNIKKFIESEGVDISEKKIEKEHDADVESEERASSQLSSDLLSLVRACWCCPCFV